MHIDSDDLLARLERDWPAEFERSRMGLLVELQAAEIERLKADVERLTALRPAATFSGSSFPLAEERTDRG